MNRTTKMFVVFVFCLIGTLLTQAATAATGTFTVGTFSTPTDLGLTPTTPIQQAVGVGLGAPVTVNGVTFSAATGQFAGIGAGTWATQTFTDPNLDTLAGTFTLAFSSFGPSSVAGTVGGLVNGQKYRLQLFTYDGDSANTSVGYRGHSIVTAGTDTLTPNFNQETVLGGFFTNEGVYIDYDFVAAATTLNVSLTPLSDATSGTGTIILTAFDVQFLPEPASLSLLAAGSLIVLRRNRRARIA